MAQDIHPSDSLSFDTFVSGVWRENPVFVAVLGTCPTLAVTVNATNAFTMGAATTFVLVGSGILVSLLRKVVPKQVRIATYIVIIAAFVTVVDYVLHAISPPVYQAMGVFLQLIVVNCIILGRAEAYASRQPVGKTIVNSLGQGLGFTLALFCLGSVREILGAGTLFGISLFGPSFEPWVIMVLPPGGFFVFGGWMLLFAWWKERQQRRLAEMQDSLGRVAHSHGG